MAIESKQRGEFIAGIESLRGCAWYWGPIGWQRAEELLLGRPRGSFLLRDSTSDRYVFTLSYSSGQSVLHARLPLHAGRFCVGGPTSAVQSPSALQLVQSALEQSHGGRLHFLMHPGNELDRAESVHLLFPVHRQLPSLACLTRLSIISRVDVERVHLLPLPDHLKTYLRNPDARHEQIR